MSAPIQISAAWFPPNERTRATSVAQMFNALGVGKVVNNKETRGTELFVYTSKIEKKNTFFIINADNFSDSKSSN